jgi:hypothetical protein
MRSLFAVAIACAVLLGWAQGGQRLEKALLLSTHSGSAPENGRLEAIAPPPAEALRPAGDSERRAAPSEARPAITSEEPRVEKEEPRVENAAAVTRYADESPLGYMETTTVPSVIAHTAPRSGSGVALLLGGTSVVQVAGHGAETLVIFADPSKPTEREMGWVPVSALQPTPRQRCGEGRAAFRNAFGSFCAAPCRDSSGCGDKEVCVPAGPAAERNGRISDLLMYCIAK